MMFKKSSILMFILILLTACTSSSYQKISAKDAKELLVSDSSVILLDVRTIAENYELRIPGSTLIPLDTLEAKAESLLANKEVKIIVYCRSGNRSKEAADILIGLGYKNVFDLGGIIDWPYETESN
jgi:phage shock protein E